MVQHLVDFPGPCPDLRHQLGRGGLLGPHALKVDAVPELVGQDRDRVGGDVRLKGLKHRSRELLRVAKYLCLGDHRLVCRHSWERRLGPVSPGDRGHEAIEVLLRTQAHYVGPLVPRGDVFRQIGLGDPARRGDRLLQGLQPGGRGPLTGEHGVVAAGGALVKPAPDAVRAIDRQRQLLHLHMEGLVSREIRLADSVLAVGEARDIGNESLLHYRVLSLHDDDLGGHAHLAQVRVRKLLLREVDGRRRLAAVDDLQALEPRDAGRAVAWLAETHLVCNDHDSIVVSHEAAWRGAQRALDACVHTLALDAEKRAHVRFQEPGSELLVEQPQRLTRNGRQRVVVVVVVAWHIDAGKRCARYLAEIHHQLVAWLAL